MKEGKGSTVDFTSFGQPCISQTALIASALGSTSVIILQPSAALVSPLITETWFLSVSHANTSIHSINTEVH